MLQLDILCFVVFFPLLILNGFPKVVSSNFFRFHFVDSSICWYLLPNLYLLIVLELKIVMSNCLLDIQVDGFMDILKFKCISLTVFCSLVNLSSYPCQKFRYLSWILSVHHSPHQSIKYQVLLLLFFLSYCFYFQYFLNHEAI